MTTTERIKDTIGAAADKLKHVAAEKVRHVARDAKDRVNVVAGEMPNTATAARTVILERHFAASPWQLFEAWTDPEKVVQWWGPEGYSTTDVSMDVRPGGRWANTMVSPEGKRYPSTGVFREVSAPVHLLMFDEGKDEPMHGHATKIEVTFEPYGTGTKMRLVHGVFQSVERRDECKAGWSSSFHRLERVVEGK